MSKVKHQEGKKDSSLDKGVRQDPVLNSFRARIEEVESKIALLDQAVTVLKSEVKFIADILRKE
ncbi:unnamed protein product [marine sediment metagenome]|uniref:Uncharacterized protein n=1 Tax=marine sediment metagenome TaxID=412755 RepID=X1SI80_9ZZZZ